MKQKGYDVTDYINHILKNLNQVYDQRTEKRPYRFVLYCKDDSKGFMPLDITLDKDGDFYTIVSTMPHRAKINGTLFFDGSANPPASTTKGILLEETSDNGGAGTSPNTHGKNNVPSTLSVAQGQKSGKKNIAYTDGRFSDKSKDDNAMRGTVKNGVITIWCYYDIVTAIPEGDAILARQTKKDRLIYSNPGLGVATASNSSAVSRPRSDNAGATKGVRPTSDKSSGLSILSVAQETDSGKKKSEPIRDEAAAYRHTLGKRNELSDQIEKAKDEDTLFGYADEIASDLRRKKENFNNRKAVDSAAISAIARRT